tara:strand:- start:2311 stop:2697 length:387 start_codon:yes stop_codon:yes gene_type:complete
MSDMGKPDWATALLDSPADSRLADNILESYNQRLGTDTKKSGLPEDAAARKAIPIYTGCINYFPNALAAVAALSLKGGLQHGQTAATLHWDRSKSSDNLDAMMRHIIDEDWDAVAWRALAHLETTLEQ